MSHKLFSMLRKTLVFSVLFVLLLGGTGCMGEILFNQMQNWNKDLRQQALDYMEEKYGEKFSLFQYDGGLVDVYPGTATTVDVVPESHPDWLVTVDYNKELAGGPFADNYVAFLLLDDMRDLIHPYVASVYGEEGTFTANFPTRAPIEPEYGRDTTAEEYMVEYSHAFKLVTTQDVANRDADAKALWELLSKSPYSTTVRITYIPPGQTNDQDFICTGVVFCYDYNKSEGYKPVSWLEGEANG